MLVSKRSPERCIKRFNIKHDKFKENENEMAPPHRQDIKISEAHQCS